MTKHSITIHYEITENDSQSYNTVLDMKLDGEDFSRSTGHLCSLLEAIDDGNFHIDNGLALLKHSFQDIWDPILYPPEPHPPSPTP